MKPISPWPGASPKRTQESGEQPPRRWNHTGFKYLWEMHFTVQAEKRRGETQNRGSHDHASERQAQQLSKGKRQQMVSKVMVSKQTGDGSYGVWDRGTREFNIRQGDPGCILTSFSPLTSLPRQYFISVILGIKPRVWFNLAPWICGCRTQGYNGSLHKPH